MSRPAVISAVRLVAALSLICSFISAAHAQNSLPVAAGPVTGSNIQVVDAGMRPSSQEITNMRQAFRDGHVIRMIGGTTEKMQELLGITLTKAEASSATAINQVPGKKTPGVLRAVAVRRNKSGQVHQLQTFTSAEDPTPQARWVKGFDAWVEQERQDKTTPRPQDSPPTLAWTLLLLSTVQHFTGYDNFLEETVSVFRLIETDQAHDWYMVLTDPSKTPNWNSDSFCNGYDHCDFHTLGGSMVTGLSPGIVADHGPTGTLQTDTVSFTIGASLDPAGGGGAAQFGESWSQPSVVTTDRTNATTGAWSEAVTFNTIRCNPAFGSLPVVSTGAFTSHQGVIFQVPEGTSTISIPVTLAGEFCAYYGDRIPIVTYDDIGSVQLDILTGPPSFSVIPAALTIPPGGKAPIRVTAIIPNSPENFAWTAMPDDSKSFLDVPPGPYAGSRDVVVGVEPQTPLGQTANVEVNSMPAFAAPSVENGPLVVSVTVGNPSPALLPPSGVLLSGGEVEGKVLNTAEVYDEKTKTDVPVGNMSSPRMLHAATVLTNGNILITGGQIDDNSPNPSDVTATAEIFDPGTSVFTPVAPMASPRFGHTSTLLGDGRVLIIGGSSLGTALGSAEIYDPKSQTFSPAGTMKTPRFLHGAVAFNARKEVIVFGGMSNRGQEGLDTWEVWNSASNTFTATGKMANGQQQFPQPLSLPNGEYVIVGGRGPNEQLLATEQLLTPANQDFNAGSNLNSIRYAHTLTALKDKTLLVTGGETDTAFATASAELRDINNWSLLSSSMTTARSGHIAALLADGTVYIAGGRDAAGTNLSSTEIYNPVTQRFSAGPLASARKNMVGTYFQLKNVPTTTNVVSNSNPSLFGAEVTLTATVTPSSASGTVTYFDGSNNLGMATLSSGQAILRTTMLAGGTHTLTASYSGNSTFLTSTSKTLTQVVQPLTTTTGLVSTPNPSSTGGVVALTATVTHSGGGAVPGAVKFFDGGTPLGTVTLNGTTAIFNTSKLSVGTHSLTAVYQGTVNYAMSTSPPVSQQVNAALIATTSAVASNNNPSGFQQQVIFTGAVTPASGNQQPTGNLLFYSAKRFIGAGALSGGVASLTTNALSVGSHAITVIYNGDNKFSGSKSPVLTQMVSEISTSTNLISGPNPSTFGLAVKFTAVVTSSSGTPTGTVSFSEGTNVLGTGTLAGGIANFTTNTLTGGSHSIVAVYGGTPTFAGSSSSPTLQVVNPASTISTVSSSMNPSNVGQSVRFKATVSSGGGGTPTGSVTFRDGVNALGSVSLNAGLASFSTSMLSAGAHLITAVYGGDANFAGSTSRVLTQTVNAAITSKVILASSLNPSQFGQRTVFTATVTSNSGTPTGTVTFKDVANTIGTIMLNSGVANLSTSNLSIGNHSITAVYSGDGTHPAATSSSLLQQVTQATSTTTLMSSVNPSLVSQAVTFTARVSSVAGAPQGTVIFNDNGNSIGSGTLKTGVARLITSSLAPSTHAITAVYQGSQEIAGSTSLVLQQVVTGKLASHVHLVSSENPSTSGENVVFTATVTSNGGSTPTGSITLSEGAKIYGSAQLVNGIGQVSIASLSGGLHSITATYGGDSTHTGATSNSVQQEVDPRKDHKGLERPSITSTR